MRMKHAVVLLSVATFGVVAAGCGDDDDVDLNPGDGTGVDLDPGEGSGLPGDAGDEGTDAPDDAVTVPVTAGDTTG